MKGVTYVADELRVRVSKEPLEKCHGKIMVAMFRVGDVIGRLFTKAILLAYIGRYGHPQCGLLGGR